LTSLQSVPLVSRPPIPFIRSESQLKRAISRRWDAGKKDRLELGRDLHELQKLLAGKGRDGEFAPWLALQGIPRTLAYYYISLVTKASGFDTSLDEFPEIDENLETKHTCPRCGYRFSGDGAKKK